MAYSGTKATIQLGQFGLLTDVAPIDIPPSALILARNIVLNEGRVQKAPGSYRFNENALPSGIVGVFDWRPSTVVQRLIAACENGSIYIDAGTGARNFDQTTPLVSGLTGLNPNCQFIAAGGETAGREKKLFFLSRGQNQVQVLTGNGTEFEPIATPAIDWTSNNYPRCGALHRNHLFLFAGQTSYASDTGDHEKFVGGDFLLQQVFPGEGGDIIAAAVFKGRLFCFKEDGFSYWLDDSNQDSELWNWRRIDAVFGVSATNAIALVIDDMLLGNDTGTLTSYLATEALGDVEAGDIFQNAQIENYLRANTSKAGIDVQHVTYYPEKKLLFATYRSAYYTYNNMLVCIDLNKKGNPRITFWQKGRPQCLGLRRDSLKIKRPMYGGQDGYVYIMDHENRSEGTVAFKGEFQTPQIDFRTVDASLVDKDKHFDYLAVTYVPEGDWTLKCDYFIDGKYIDTIEFPMLQYTKPKLGADAQDEDAFMLNESRLAQPNTETISRKLAGHGKVISFRFWNDGLNQSFQVCSITIGFRPGGEKAQKTT